MLAEFVACRAELRAYLFRPKHFLLDLDEKKCVRIGVLLRDRPIVFSKPLMLGFSRWKPVSLFRSAFKRCKTYIVGRVLNSHFTAPSRTAEDR